MMRKVDTAGRGDALTARPPAAWQGRRRGGSLLLALAVAISCAAVASPSRSQSLGDRFKDLFGMKSKPEPAAPASGAAAAEDLTCPSVSVRSGASTYAVGLPGKAASGADLRFQATIGETARECNYNTDTHQISIRVGIEGRVIVGPAGAPPSVEIPLRIAVVQDGVSPKTIATKAYTIPVEVPGVDGASYRFVADDIAYPAPTGADADRYTFYIGFDPQALRPEPKPRAKRRK